MTGTLRIAFKLLIVNDRGKFAAPILGIPYDLRQDYLAEGFGKEETAEFDRSETIEAIAESLEELGFATDR